MQVKLGLKDIETLKLAIRARRAWIYARHHQGAITELYLSDLNRVEEILNNMEKEDAVHQK